MRNSLLHAFNHNLRDSFFEDFFGPSEQAWRDTSKPMSSYDLEESESHFLLTMDLPGIKSEDLSITSENNVLTIHAKREKKHSNDTDSTKTYGRYYGELQRSFHLPENVNAEAIEANYENGELSIALPKLEKAKPKKIEVKANGGSSFWSKFLPSSQNEKDLN